MIIPILLNATKVNFFLIQFILQDLFLKKNDFSDVNQSMMCEFFEKLNTESANNSKSFNIQNRSGCYNILNETGEHETSVLILV